MTRPKSRMLVAPFSAMASSTISSSSASESGSGMNSCHNGSSCSSAAGFSSRPAVRETWFRSWERTEGERRSCGESLDPPAEDVPVEVEDRLPAALTHVHEDAVVLEAGLAGGLRDEVEHPLCLIGRELANLAKGRDVPLGQDEQVRVGPRVDVANRDEAVGFRNVVAFLHELAEETVLRQRGSPPPRLPVHEPGR